jgi:hypothetical protein
LFFFQKKKLWSGFPNPTFPLFLNCEEGQQAATLNLSKTESRQKTSSGKLSGKGVRQYDPWEGIKESIRKYRLGKTSLKEVVKAIAHIVYPIQLEKSKGREKGYVYFQQFLPDCKFDIRVQIVNNKAWAMRRTESGIMIFGLRAAIFLTSI